MPQQNPADHFGVADIALVEGDIAGDGVAKAGREVVDDHQPAAVIAQRQNNVAADVAAAAGD